MHLFKRLIFILSFFILTAMLPCSATAGDYVIGEGDSLSISVWGVERLNFGVTVRPDGKITIPGFGDVLASGFTSMGLGRDLSVKLKEMVKNPIVSVTVSGIANSKVYVFGNGIKSGIFDVIRRTTLLQILCTLSDLKSADLSRSYVQRNGKKIKENFEQLIIKGDTNEDILLENGDVIFMPLLQEKFVYVLGEVGSPKAILYRDEMTILEAIFDAGNFTKFAGQNDVTIIRQEGGQKALIPVKMKNLLKKGDLTQNIKVSPGDYIMVEESLF